MINDKIRCFLEKTLSDIFPKIKHTFLEEKDYQISAQYYNRRLKKYVNRFSIRWDNNNVFILSPPIIHCENYADELLKKLIAFLKNETEINGFVGYDNIHPNKLVPISQKAKRMLDLLNEFPIYSISYPHGNFNSLLDTFDYQRPTYLLECDYEQEKLVFHLEEIYFLKKQNSFSFSSPEEVKKFFSHYQKELKKFQSFIAHIEREYEKIDPFFCYQSYRTRGYFIYFNENLKLPIYLQILPEKTIICYSLQERSERLTREFSDYEDLRNFLIPMLDAHAKKYRLPWLFETSFFSCGYKLGRMFTNKQSKLVFHKAVNEGEFIEYMKLNILDTKYNPLTEIDIKKYNCLFPEINFEYTKGFTFGPYLLFSKGYDLYAAKKPF